MTNIDETKVVNAVNYFEAIIREVEAPPTKILDDVEELEGAVFWSEGDRETVIENYRNTFALFAFCEKEELIKELITGSRRNGPGVETASARILSLRHEFDVDDQLISELGENFLRDMAREEISNWNSKDKTRK